jgi:hypothetical protein
MAGLVPAIHVFASTRKIVDDRRKAGHDRWVNAIALWYKIDRTTHQNLCAELLAGIRSQRSVGREAATIRRMNRMLGTMPTYRPSLGGDTGDAEDSNLERYA